MKLEFEISYSDNTVVEFRLIGDLFSVSDLLKIKTTSQYLSDTGIYMVALNLSDVKRISATGYAALLELMYCQNSVTFALVSVPKKISNSIKLFGYSQRPKVFSDLQEMCSARGHLNNSMGHTHAVLLPDYAVKEDHWYQDCDNYLMLDVLGKPLVRRALDCLWSYGIRKVSIPVFDQSDPVIQYLAEFPRRFQSILFYNDPTRNPSKVNNPTPQHLNNGASELLLLPAGYIPIDNLWIARSKFQKSINDMSAPASADFQAGKDRMRDRTLVSADSSKDQQCHQKNPILFTETSQPLVESIFSSATTEQLRNNMLWGFEIDANAITLLNSNRAARIDGCYNNLMHFLRSTMFLEDYVQVLENYWSGTDVKLFSQLNRATKTVIGDSSTVSKNVKLLGINYIGKNSIVAEGTTLENCIVLPNSNIQPHSAFRNSIIGGNPAMSFSSSLETADLQDNYEHDANFELRNSA